MTKLYLQAVGKYAAGLKSGMKQRCTFTTSLPYLAIRIPMTKGLAERRNVSTHALVITQGALVLTSLAFLLLAPTESRPMMLIPLEKSHTQATAKIASDGDRRLLGNGPIEGSLIVLGAPPNPLTTLLQKGVLTVAVSYSSCTSNPI